MKNFWGFVFGILLLALGAAGWFGVGPLVAYQDQRNLFIAPAVIGLICLLWASMSGRTYKYELTSQRLLITRGLLGRTTDSLELYRVRDIQILQPFSQRIAGLHTIRLVTDDSVAPRVIIPDVPANLDLPNKLRHYVEECRVAKNVRDVNIDVEHPVQG